MFKNNLGRLEAEANGFLYCDGIAIDNVYFIDIDYCDDIITLFDKNNKEVGSIFGIDRRKNCVFSEETGSFIYKDYEIIKNGKVVI